MATRVSPRTVRVTPPIVDVCDVLEYAQALIEEHGWRQGKRVPDNENWPEVAKNGLSLHDSIGMACFVLSGETSTQTRPVRAWQSSKDFPTASRATEFGYTGTMRSAATAMLNKHLGGASDIDFNDKAANVTEVLKVLDAAIQEACSAKQ